MIVETVLLVEVEVPFKDDTGTRGTPAVISNESREEDMGSEEPMTPGFTVEVTDEAAR